MKNHITYLENLDACSEAVKWAKDYPTLQQAWNNCDRGDWMLWLVGKQSGPPETKSRKKLVLAACKCARLSLKHVPKGERRPIKAIQTAEKWANGDSSITLQDVRNASDAAYASDAADDAAYAAAYAAYAAAAAADAADAAADAADAADAAGNKMKLKILKYGIKLLRGDK